MMYLCLAWMSSELYNMFFFYLLRVAHVVFIVFATISLHSLYIFFRRWFFRMFQEVSQFHLTIAKKGGMVNGVGGIMSCKLKSLAAISIILQALLICSSICVCVCSVFPIFSRFTDTQCLSWSSVCCCIAI